MNPRECGRLKTNPSEYGGVAVILHKKEQKRQPSVLVGWKERRESGEESPRHGLGRTWRMAVGARRTGSDAVRVDLTGGRGFGRSERSRAICGSFGFWS
jgi:hypothetical protein